MTAPRNPNRPPDPGPQDRLAITGLGLVTPLGVSAWATFAALLAGRTLPDRTRDWPYPDDVDPVDLVKGLGCVATVQHTSTDPSIPLAETVAREGLGEGVSGLGSGVSGDASASSLKPQTSSLRPPCFIGASKGAVHALDAALTRRDPRPSRSKIEDRKSNRKSEIRNQKSLPTDADLAVALGPLGYLSHHVQRRLNLGQTRCVVAACASSLTALHEARLLLLRDPGVSRVLVLSAESPMLPQFVHSYRRLGVLPPLEVGQYVGRPLDRARQGFMLAELAAAVVVERIAPGEPWPSDACELLDTAIASESYDIVRSNPDMPALAQVARQLLLGRAVTMIHPHATGTAENDQAELAVYERVLAPRASSLEPVPALYAVKGAVGHGLGAAGLVSLVTACLIARTGKVPPMPWLTQPLASPFTLHPQAGHIPRTGTTHAVFTAGFGGHVAGALMRRV